MQHDTQLMFTGIPRKGSGNPETTRFKREDKINYSAQTMERFLYQGLFCWQPPGNDVNEKILRMGRSDEYLNRYSQLFGDYHPRLFAGTFATHLHSVVLEQLYKGKDPIKREPVVLGKMMSEYHRVLDSLPDSKYTLNALSGANGFIDSFAAAKRESLRHIVILRKNSPSLMIKDTSKLNPFR